MFSYNIAHRTPPAHLHLPPHHDNNPQYGHIWQNISFNLSSHNAARTETRPAASSGELPPHKHHHHNRNGSATRGLHQTAQTPSPVSTQQGRSPQLVSPLSQEHSWSCNRGASSPADTEPPEKAHSNYSTGIHLTPPLHAALPPTTDFPANSPASPPLTHPHLKQTPTTTPRHVPAITTSSNKSISERKTAFFPYLVSS